MNDVASAPDELTPKCIRHGQSSVNYDLFEIDDAGEAKRLVPTPSGFKLRHNCEYQLRIQTHGEHRQLRDLRFNRQPFIDGSPIAEPAKSIVGFHTSKSFIDGGWLPLFRNLSGGELTARITFEDTKSVSNLKIPVVLASRWWMVPMIVGGLLLGAGFPVYIGGGAGWYLVPTYICSILTIWLTWLAIGQYVDFHRARTARGRVVSRLQNQS